MSIKFKTEELSKIVAQLNKLNPSKLLEITNYWHILGDGESVMFTAYDGSNFLRCIIDSEVEIDVMVKAEQFGKLVDKTTSATITLVPEESSLKVIGNGEYNLDIVTEDEDYPTFDQYLEDVTEDNALTLDSSMFYQIANINDSAVSKSGADGIYTGFLLDEGKAITTDIIRVCINPISNKSLKMLIPYNLMSILASIPDEKVYLWQVDETTIYVSSASVEVYGKLMEGMEEYEDVSQLNSLEFVDTAASIPTVPLLNVLDRLVLFTSAFDKGTVELLFLKDRLRIKTSTSSYEDIAYSEVGKKASKKEFTCLLNSLLLKEIVATISEENFSVEYGSENAIKISSNGVVYFLALQEGEE